MTTERAAGLLEALCDATVVDERVYFNDDKTEHGRAVLTNLEAAGYTVVPMTASPDRAGLPDEGVARLFHEAYERLAPDFGYRTREASAKPWDDVPEQNRALMAATVHEVRAALAATRDSEGPCPECAAWHAIGHNEGNKP